MAKGGRRKGSGAPKGAQNAKTHGLYSKAIEDPEVLRSYNEHLERLRTDPKEALLSSAALIYAHVDRVVRAAKAGFLALESKTSKETMRPGSEGKVVFDATESVDTSDMNEVKHEIKNIEVTLPIAEALYKAARITANAHEIDRAKLETEQRMPAEIAMLRAKVKMLEQGHNPDGANITVVIPDSLKRDGE